MMTGNIFGRVIDSDGAPVQGAAVFIAGGPAAVPDIAAETDGDGEFSFDSIPAGSWRIRATAAGGRTGEAVAEVGGGAKARVTIRLGRGLRPVG